MRNLSGLYGDDGSLDTSENFYDPDALQSRRLSPKNRARIPPLDIARRLFAVQYTYIGTIFSFTDPDAFEQSLLEAHQGPPETSDKEARLRYAKVLMVLAFGQLYSINQWIDFKGPPGFEYFTAALELLPDIHEEGSILCVETLAYVGYFMQNMNRRDAAFLYIGMALRMAISLGLHQEVAVTGLTETTLEHRRRVWWSIYSLDRIVSVKSGNPLTIQDEDIGIAMPSRLPREPEYCPAVVLRHYTELSRILGDVLSCIYRKTPKSGSRLMASVRNIMVSLHKWHREVPDDLRFDPVKLSISRESVSTFLHYYQCINMTARPLLFHVVHQRLKDTHGGATKEQDWKIGLSQTTIRVIEMCISAAQDTINMMAIAAQLDLVATYGYMDGEHAFSATIVLVMVCGAFSTNVDTIKAMNAGLDLLRDMSQRGNSHMGARYELLAHLKSILMPGAGPSGTVVSPGPATAPTFSNATNSKAQVQPTINTSNKSVQSQGLMMLGHIPNVGGADFGIGSTFGFAPGTEFTGSHAFADMCYDVDASFGINVGSDDDSMLWEEGFADPAGYDLTQWTQVTQMAVDGGNAAHFIWDNADGS
jgi:proline utilization trans-activator